MKLVELSVDIIDLLTSDVSVSGGLTASDITYLLLSRMGLPSDKYTFKRVYDRVSYWLSALVSSGVIITERVGRRIIYRPSPTTKRGQAFIQLVPNDGGEEIVAAGDTLFVDTDSGTIVVFLNRHLES